MNLIQDFLRISAKGYNYESEDKMQQSLSHLFPFIVFAIAILTAFLLSRFLNFKTDSSRNGNIDALRGFLAFGVFIHHVDLWFHYLHTGKWNFGSSIFYKHLGGISVSLFFMITSYLFISRILRVNEIELNWKKLFISRFLRLFPLYFFSISILIFIVFATSGWLIQVPFLKLIKNIGHWLSFTIVSDGIINANPFTGLINAGVVWSLPFEWVFYFSLPVITLFINPKKVGIVYILAGILFIAGFIKIHGFELKHVLSFSGGAIAPLIMKYGKKNISYDRWYFSLIIILAFLLIIIWGELSHLLVKICLAIIFTLIALGNTLAGVLRSRALKFLGEICYSTYLLHGILLFVVLYFIIGIDSARSFSSFQYCFVFTLATPLLVFISYFGFQYIEKPFIDYSKKIK